ncbi:MAG: NRAMP family divalent metal transporter, partial [Nocardioidaceae bacterium]
GVALDRVVIALGVLMIGLTTYVALTSSPPVGDALRESVIPYTTESEFLVITTIIGGTVGGYITYAGAHRLLDTGITGVENVGHITRSSVTSILVTGVMRIVLFLAILGVVAGGVELAAANPTADAFESAAGEAGLRLFGIILWAASITSVIGASYTSVSFMTKTSTSPRVRNFLTVGFILVTAVIYLIQGEAPVKLLIFAGAFNGLILPVGFGVLLWVAWRRRDLLRGYVYPKWLLILGILAWMVSVYLAYKSMGALQDL